MPSFQARALAATVTLMGVRRMWDPERLDATIAKDRSKGAAQPDDLEKRFVVRKEMIMGQAVFTVTPKGRMAQRQILYFHGGGFVMSITQPHWEFVGKIADLLDATMTVPTYPLAPEHSIDDTLAMVMPLYERLVRQYPGRLTVMGDSGGGNLTLVVAMQARDAGYPLPSQIVLVSPGLDFSFSNPVQMAIDRRDPILSLRGMKKLGHMRAGRYDIRDPKISPLFGNLRCLPPIAVLTGTRDITNPDAHTLRDKLTELGSPPAFFEYPEMMHVWPLFPVPEAERVRRQIVDFIKQHEALAAAPAAYPFSG